MGESRVMRIQNPALKNKEKKEELRGNELVETEQKWRTAPRIQNLSRRQHLLLNTFTKNSQAKNLGELGPRHFQW
jgi:hypothetical protein